MEDLDYHKLIKLVKDGTKPSFKAYLDDDNKLAPNVANLGAKVNDIAKLTRSGEYSGITVQFMETARRLLTDRFVIQILKQLEKEDYVTPLDMLSIINLDTLLYILHTWMERAVEGYDNSMKLFEKKWESYDDWIKTTISDPLLSKIKVIEIGHNKVTGDSVVPPEWIDRVFESGYAMQAAMSKLESRIGKPPVTYAIIYSMNIDKQDSIITDPKSFEHLFYLDLVKRKVVARKVDKIEEGYVYVKCDKVLIGFRTEEILEPKESVKKNKDVGLLVSRMQKAIRRGRYGSKILIETVTAVNECPNYNLPEHGFMRVSASKQLAWRLFITIVEDVRPYDNPELLGMLELILLVLITRVLLEYRFTKPVMNQILRLAVTAQYNDDSYEEWNELKIAEKIQLSDDSFKNSLVLALDNLTMMAGDNKMLRRYYSLKKVIPFKIPVFSKLESKESIDKQIALASYDQHNRTYIILYYQACIGVGLTTKEISKHIWDVSSCFNVRYHEAFTPDKLLTNIQSYLVEKISDRSSFASVKTNKIEEIEMNENDMRTSFLTLFGAKYRYGSKDVILAGTDEYPIRIKIKDVWTNSDDISAINAFPNRTIRLTSAPPIGFRWKERSVTVSVKNGKPYINGKKVPMFDGSSVLEPNLPVVNERVSEEIADMITRILSGSAIRFSKLLFLRNNKTDRLLDWIPEKADTSLLKLAYTKLHNLANDIITVGPVTRAGMKMQNAIDYIYEGKLWAIFNLFSYLYPDSIKPNGAVNFMLRSNAPGYVHLVYSLEKLLFVPVKITKTVLPTITTKLWDHQQDSVSKITYGFSQGKKGYGDASNVGAGKTLTALEIAAKMMSEDEEIYSGVLVLLPGNKLIQTWKDEIEKHTEGFDVRFHVKEVKDIRRNTLVVSTMGRMRDHPVDHNWLLVVIDECLTVQNRAALWTESAWKQSTMAMHLVMMSATFFRTRFDKLYYMLKMLHTGLPENKYYLDTILSESIVSQVSNIKLPWTSTIHYLGLDKRTRREYDEIANNSNLSTEALYSKLMSVLVTSSKTSKILVNHLREILDKIEERSSRCLIYARSDAEAKFWSEGLGISIYPKKGKHCIVTLSDGTYGLNDLVIYDTIMMRPPAPDKLPQIRGRLDRPGQEAKQLYIEYFLFKDTIEMGLILRMNIASQFVQKYIMPLATFYDISVRYSEYD